jgi:tetratricopeptide (TPR) repeat protein
MASVAPARAPLTPGERRQIENLFQLGLVASSEDRHDDAIRYWEIVWHRDPDYSDVALRLKQEYLARGMESWASSDVDAAVESWEAVLRIDPRDERANGYLRRAYEQDARLRQITRDREVAESDE